jgi:hypothetical protein
MFRLSRSRERPTREARRVREAVEWQATLALTLPFHKREREKR